MKKLMFFLLGMIACISAAAQGFSETGNWSEPVNGLRARLHFNEEREAGGRGKTALYLELQNVSDKGPPMEIYFDIYNLRFNILDAESRPIKPTVFPPYSIHMPEPYWITLPYDSTLRFVVPFNFMIMLEERGVFFPIPYPRKHDYFLAGKLVVKPSKEPQRYPWKGVIDIPKVKLPQTGP